MTREDPASRERNDSDAILKYYANDACLGRGVEVHTPRQVCPAPWLARRAWYHALARRAPAVQKGATRRDSLREARSLAGKSLRARLPLRQEKKASKWGYWATINEFNSKTDPRPPADSGFLHRSLQRLLYGGLDAVRRLQLRTRSSRVDEGVRKDLQGPRPA